jgi:hypothetical protein
MRRVLAILAIGTLQVAAQTGSWSRIRYAGGTVAAKVNPFDWNSTLTVSPRAVTLSLGPRVKLELRPEQVKALGYGKEAHRRVADMVALSLVATPVALFGLLHKSTTHFVSVEFMDSGGKPGAVLLEADKNNYRAILTALEKATGQTVKDVP